ncbi:MAG: lipoate--protein ligase family protein [Cyanobacteriota bacterium]|nr:lipoate--protein ligase family protein [Cyanobacteriota bacterium]
MAPLLRWLPSLTLAGSWQMAIDAWLLDRVITGERGGPALRFYRWSQPTLSLGKHQGEPQDHWLRLVREGRLALVRRPTGGSAVLHGGDLTYALLWPNPPRQRREAYRLCCQWLREAFAALGHPLRFGDAPATAAQPNCFASSTAADLVHDDGGKRVGSAQLWRSGSLLQQGSIQLEPDDALWRAVFGEPAPRLSALPLTMEDLEAHLLAAALRWLPGASAGPPGPHHAADAGDGVSAGGRPTVDELPAASLCRDPLTDADWRAIGATLHRYEVRGCD